MSTTQQTPSVCVIVPAYNEAGRIGAVLSRIREHAVDIVVVDDGSRDDTARVAREHGAIVIPHEHNQGKGAALLTGLAYAREHHFDVVITLDADGQHDPAEIPRFLDAFQRTGIPVLVGNRLWDKKNMPVVRRWTNQGMSRLLSRIMKTYLPDTQCGFRLYRADILVYIPVESRRFAMESEILLQLALRGFRMDSVRIPTLYRDETSRINPIHDTVRFFLMLIRFHHEQRMRRG